MKTKRESRRNEWNIQSLTLTAKDVITPCDLSKLVGKSVYVEIKCLGMKSLSAIAILSECSPIRTLNKVESTVAEELQQEEEPANPTDPAEEVVEDDETSNS